jgi:mandelamide amidase
MVVPTTSMPARPIREDDTVDLNGKRVPAFQTLTRNAAVGSAGHLPCLTLPAGVTGDGLPVGMEFVGPAVGDAPILALGRALQRAFPAIPGPPV